MMPVDIWRRIAAMGHELTPTVLADVRALYEAEQLAGADQPAIASDISYGPDPRHALDLYAEPSAAMQLPIMIWVHGGGFVRGAKAEPDHPYEAHMGRFAARNGFLGVVINYRLAPEHGWPAGGEDIARSIAWLKLNAAKYGGDSSRILLVGTSAGAAHIATYLQLNPDSSDVVGVVLLSGLYGYTPITDEMRDLLYFGRDPELHSARAAGPALERTNIPIFVSCAEFDPERFQLEFVGLLQGRLKIKGNLPVCYVAMGHNHFSQPYHIGTEDVRLSDEILAFSRQVLLNYGDL